MAERPSGPEQGNDLERQVGQKIQQRRRESEQMIEQRKSVTEMLEHFDNDYSDLETLYREKTGGELLADAYESPEHEVAITKSCSIVIPAYNNSERLENCLRAIQASSFNAKYPQLLEVVIVDDESPRENIAEKVEAMGLSDLNIKVYRQSNGQVSKGRYSGVLNASGEVVIITDPDIVYTQNTIEEYMKRQQVLDGLVMFGLRDEIDTADERLGEGIENGRLSELPIGVSADPRVKRDGMADSAWLKDSGHNKRLPIDVESERLKWNISSIAWGMSVCARREDLLKTMSGYDERYRGYGGDDEDMMSRLMSLGNYVVPNTAGLCYHQRHPAGNQDESKHQANVAVLRENLGSPLKTQAINNPRTTDAELRYESRNGRIDAKDYEKPPLDERAQGSEELKMGNYAKALEIFERIQDRYMGDFWFWYDMACAQIGVGGEQNLRSAVNNLEYLSTEREDTWVYSTLAQAYAALGDYASADWHYHKSLELYADNDEGKLVLSDSKGTADRARAYLKNGKYRSALECLDAAITAQKGENEADPWMIFDKGVCLERLGDLDLAIQNLLLAKRRIPNNTWINSRLGIVYEKSGSAEKARRYYQEALNLDNQNVEALEGIRRIG